MDDVRETEIKQNREGIVQFSKLHYVVEKFFIPTAILLLIVPILTLLTYLYYAIGGRANTIIDVVDQTIYVTEPNTRLNELENLETDIGFFSMDVEFDTFKQIGKEEYRMKTYRIPFLFNFASFPERDFYTDTPYDETPYFETETLFHPEALITYNQTHESEKLSGLPEETVVEAYVSLNDIYSPDEIRKMFKGKYDLVWFAVDTGLEATQKDKDGQFITPIGYPAQTDEDNWSPFNSSKTNEKQFVEILDFLAQHEKAATMVAHAKSLALKERIPYIKENGINIYGMVVTGPKEEVESLKDHETIRSIKVGEVRLWNWY